MVGYSHCRRRVPCLRISGCRSREWRARSADNGDAVALENYNEAVETRDLKRPKLWSLEVVNGRSKPQGELHEQIVPGALDILVEEGHDPVRPDGCPVGLLCLGAVWGAVW